jgi:hypothetical protein
MVAGLLQEGKSNSKLIWAIHHLATDIVSWQILSEDLLTLLKQYPNNPLPPLQKTTSYRYWTETLNHYLQNSSQESQYWTNSQNINIPSFPVQIPYERAQDKESLAKNVVLTLGKEETTKLLTHTRCFSISTILYSAFMMAYQRWSGSSTVRIYTEHHGRDNHLFPQLNVSRTVGWFVHIYPLILEAQTDIKKQLEWTQILLSKIPHHGLGYLGSRFKSTSKIPPIEILFYHVGGLNNQTYQFLLDDFVPVFAPDANRIAQLSFVTAILEDELKMVLRYSTFFQEESNVKAFGEAFKESMLSFNQILEKGPHALLTI